jgi:hypothetical protein
MNSVEKYLFQALDSYPFSLEETIESLDYALSLDPQNTMALTMYGRIYSEQLKNHEVAKTYFEQALSVNIHALEVYGPYLDCLIQNDDFEEAEKLMAFALGIKGIDVSEILIKKVLILEHQMKLKEAKEAIKEVILANCNNFYLPVIDDMEDRIQEKLKILFPEKYKKKKKKKGNQGNNNSKLPF